MTQSARDRADAAGATLSRRHLDYVARTVLSAHEGADPMSADDLAETFADLTLQRMTDLRIIEATPGRAHAAMIKWLAVDEAGGP